MTKSDNSDCQRNLKREKEINKKEITSSKSKYPKRKLTTSSLRNQENYLIFNKTSPKYSTGGQNHQEVLKKDAILKITEYERRIFEKESMTS